MVAQFYLIAAVPVGAARARYAPFPLQKRYDNYFRHQQDVSSAVIYNNNIIIAFNKDQ